MNNITKERYANGKPRLRRFHQARWDEPIIFELSGEGERGILLPDPEPAIEQTAGNAISALPEGLRRKQPPRLPEISQPQLVRHYTRLSQETLGVDVNVDIGQGTCTMKYSPKVNELLARMPKMAELHPLEPEETIQGILEIFYRF
ncbi:glycine dehydrogenase subunit 2, partial [Candidatus Bipolaricaulota bacterium]|nr:glycine dehydrogenase subunit 2 [Candidatus Bipolaricaulota bacterium]